MKKIYYFISLCVFSFTIKAQYTVTAAANPVVGDIDQSWDLDPSVLPLGSPGTNQIWNYTGIIISPSTAVTSNSYVTTSTAPNASLYPSANIAVTSDASGYGMYAYTSSGITVYGFTSSNLTVVYQNPEILVSYPFTYGTISSDTYSTSYTYSSVPISTNGTITVTGDGSGTLNTPGHSYTNVLRLKIQTTEITNAGSFGTSTNTAVGYTYLSSLTKFQLLSVNNSTSATSTSTVITTDKSGTVNNMVLAGIKESKKDANFSIYPNPTSDKKIELYFVLANEENYTATIYNTLGQKVKLVELGSRAPGIYNEPVDLTSLEAGVYYLHLKGNKQEGIQKIVIQ